jgi:hypothetical protein
MPWKDRQTGLHSPRPIVIAESGSVVILAPILELRRECRMTRRIQRRAEP